MELAARKEQQYLLNPTAKDPRQWFAGATDTLEEVLMMRLGALPCHVVVTAHVDRDKDEVHGYLVSQPSAPGRLRSRLGAAFSEFYRAYVQLAGDQRLYLWQTRPDAYYNANTSIGVPSPCPQGFEFITTFLS